MIRKILLSSVALATISTASFAADLPNRKEPPPVFVAAPVFTWAGFYVGLNAGAAFGSSNNRAGAFGFAPGGDPTVGGLFFSGNNNDAEFMGGGQIGYNFQSGALVYGLETDIQGIANGGGNNALVGPIVGPAGRFPYAIVHNGGQPSWFGTLRGRLGYSFDRALIYATGGLAYGGGSSGGSVAYFSGANGSGVATANYFSRSNDTNVGWTVGGGVEYAINNNWSAKLEYLYVDLGGNNLNYVSLDAAAPVGAVFTGRGNSNAFSVVRAGINYKF